MITDSHPIMIVAQTPRPAKIEAAAQALRERQKERLELARIRNMPPPPDVGWRDVMRILACAWIGWLMIALDVGLIRLP